MPAKQERRESPTVEQDHRLLAAFKAFADRLQKTSREDRLLSLGRVLFPHVDDLHIRQRPILDSRSQVNVSNFFRSAFRKDSIEGVADPRTTVAPSRCARTIAVSRAW